MEFSQDHSAAMVSPPLNSSNSSLQFEGQMDNVTEQYDSWKWMVSAAFFTLCVVVTVSGNVLVLTAFIVNRSLRAPRNYFVVSLAVSDILIGAVSMPTFALYAINGSWDFGPLLCDFWLSLDYSVCLVSQYTILSITIDRFCSIKFPIKHKLWQSGSRAACVLGLMWTAPVVLFSIRIFFGDRLVKNSPPDTGQCTPQFIYDRVFNVVLTAGYFAKIAIMIILYSMMYDVARGVNKKSLIRCELSSVDQKRTIAFRTKISSIVGTFVLCWTPYNILAVIETFCTEPPCNNRQLFMISYFLCYINATLNPFCYAFANHQFKVTFFRLLKGDFHRN